MSDLTLRDYQKDGLREVRARLDQGPVLLQMPTGTGKTRTAAAAAKAVLARGQRFGFMVPYIGLIGQTAREFEPWVGASSFGVVQANHEWTDASKPCQFLSACTVDSRHRKGEPFPELDVVFFDETHIVHGVIPAWIAAAPRTKFVGLTATPYTPGLGNIYTGGKVRPITTQEAIDAGYLVGFDIFAPSKPDLEGVRASKLDGDYSVGDVSKRMMRVDLVGSILDEWQRRADGRPTMLFAPGVAYAEFMAGEFNKRGIAAEWATADTDPDEREAIAERSRSGETKVVCNCDIFTTGTDWPWLECAVIARPTKSPAKFVQIVGRVLRTYTDKATGYTKSRALLLDFSDNHMRLGRVTDIDRRHDELCTGTKKAGSAEREKAENPEPTVKCCPTCSHVVASYERSCGSCGYAWPVKHNVRAHDGELVAFGSGPVSRVKPAKTGKAFLQGLPRKSVYAQLLFISRTRGHKDGWAYHKYCEIFDLAGNERLSFSKSKLEPPCRELESWLTSRQIARSFSKQGGGNA